MQTLTLSASLDGQVVFKESAAPFSHNPSAVSEDVLARGRALAADASYPPFDICERIAASFVNHPDDENGRSIFSGPMK